MSLSSRDRAAWSDPGACCETDSASAVGAKKASFVAGKRKQGMDGKRSTYREHAIDAEGSTFSGSNPTRQPRSLFDS